MDAHLEPHKGEDGERGGGADCTGAGLHSRDHARHEEKASRWAIQHVVPHEKYIHALHNGICEVWDLAEYFGVTNLL